MCFFNRSSEEIDVLKERIDHIEARLLDVKTMFDSLMDRMNKVKYNVDNLSVSINKPEKPVEYSDLIKKIMKK